MTPRILIVYGTTHGQTGKIAHALGDALRADGFDIVTVEADDASDTPEAFAGVIVAASVNAGGYQKGVRRWVRTHAAALADRPNAFVSVCLGVLQHDREVDAHLQRIIAEFTSATGWMPDTVKIVAGALPYSRYNVITRWVMKRIVRKAGGDTDTSRDYEYTDWADVRAFARAFGGRLIPERAMKEPA